MNTQQLKMFQNNGIYETIKLVLHPGRETAIYALRHSCLLFLGSVYSSPSRTDSSMVSGISTGSTTGMQPTKIIYLIYTSS